MSKGLGKLERWILQHAYLKANKGYSLPEGWKAFNSPTVRTNVPGKGIIVPRAPEGSLLKAEVIFNYYPGIVMSTRRLSWLRNTDDAFVANPAYRAALTSYRRATKSLLRKGIIELHGRWYGGEKYKYTTAEESYSDNGAGIVLTQTGKDRAKEFISVNIGQ